jgi:outer membrane protein
MDRRSCRHSDRRLEPLLGLKILFVEPLGMKCLFVLLGGSLLLVRLAPAEDTLTWDQCVRLATLNNPDMVASHESLRSYEAKYGGSYSAYFPQITASAGGTYTHSPATTQATGSETVSTSGGATYSGGSFGGVSNQLHQYTASVTVSQTLYDGGLTPGNVAQAGANYRAQVAAFVVEKSLISYDLKSAFAQLLYAQELVTLTGEIVQRRRSDADLIHLKWDGGRENKGAYLLSESDYRQAVLDFHNAQRNVVVSQHQLAQVMGVKVPPGTVALGKLITMQPPASPDFEKLSVGSPTHFEQVSETESSRAGITIARAGFLPTVAVSASLEREDTRFFPKSDGWNADFSVSIPIFDGGKTYFDVKSAEASLRQALANLKSSDDSSVYTLAQNYSTLVSDIEAVVANQQTVAAQKVRSEIGEGQYSNGLISFTDFNLIENDLVTAEKQELQSRRDAVIAESNWEYAQGKGVIP